MWFCIVSTFYVNSFSADNEMRFTEFVTGNGEYFCPGIKADMGDQNSFQAVQSKEWILENGRVSHRIDKVFLCAFEEFY